MPIGPLPDLDTLDVAALKDMVIRQHAQISTHDAEIERLRLIIARLRRLQFGRKSEKIQKEIEQLELQLEDLEAASAEKREQTEKTLAPAAAAVFAEAVRRPARRPLPEHLPREVEIHEPEQKGCPACGGNLRRLGEDVSEMLEYVPARFKVIRHVRPKLSCTKCDVIVQTEAPARPVARGLAGPGLLAHVLVSKYADHQPLYRQSEIYAREGVELERSTLADWVGAASELLRPLYEALRQHVMNARKLHADDTPVPVLTPGQGKTKQGRLWTYVRDDRPASDRTAPAVWSLTRLIGKESTHSGIWQTSGALCRPMRMPGSTGCTTVVTFKRRPAGPMFGVSSSTCMKHMLPPLLPKLWNALVLFMSLNAKYEAGRQRNDNESDRADPGLC